VTYTELDEKLAAAECLKGGQPVVLGEKDALVSR
jgi:hypothetical protein